MTSIPTQVTPTAEVIGHFDYILEGRAYGWAYAPAHPKKHLAINIETNGEVIAHGHAEQFREDLQDAGIGDGYFMFDLQISHELFDGQIYSLTAYDAETGIVLNGGPHSFGPEQRDSDYPQIPRTTGLELLSEELRDSRYAHYSGKLESFSSAYRLGSRLQETGNLVEARNAWTAINNALGENSICYCKLGECLLLEGAATEALEAFRIAAGSNLKQHWAHFGIANSLYKLGRFEDAEEAMQVAIALQPQNAALRQHLHNMQQHALPQRVEILLSGHNRVEAVDLLKSVLLKDPENSQAFGMLAKLLSEPGEMTQPGALQLSNFRNAQRILDALLDDVENRLNENSAQ